MKKIMLIDTNYGFTSDVESRLILDDIEGIEILTRNNINIIHEQIEKEHPDELLISADLINSHNWDFGIPVKSYAKKAEGISLAQERGIPTYGVIKGAGELIKAIESNSILNIKERNVQNEIPVDISNEQKVEKPAAVNSGSENLKKTEPLDILNAEKEILAKPLEPDRPLNRYEGEDMTVKDKLQEQNMQQDSIKTQNTASASNRGKNDLKARLEEARKKEQEERLRKEAEMRRNGLSADETAVERDMGNIQPPAKLITVYSAKGGVGKTTISSELATYLALTSHGRGRYKVCIADYNIDFGDVLNTLNFDAKKACMTVWAADIRERIAAGEEPEQITYTESQISVWLQKDAATGLSALLAPMTNEDSMDISEVELEIMLTNLVEHGGFDFVVCDTGNNTRDSSFIPLEKADDIILVLTQSVNTANCNAGFMQTMRKINFDMSRIRIVINQAQSTKSVGVAVDEVIEAFINPETGRPFDVLGVIKYSNDEKQANNMGKPLVLKSSHEFTKSIGSIATHLIGENFVLEQPKKKGFLSKLFKK